MKVDRLVSIIMILLDKERIGAKALADMFEVSPRTIYRDIETINMAGIPVRSTPGVGGGFEIMQKYKIDRKVFSAADLSVLSDKMVEFVQRSRETRQTFFHVVKGLLVQGQNAHDRRQVVCRP